MKPSELAILIMMVLLALSCVQIPDEITHNHKVEVDVDEVEVNVDVTGTVAHDVAHDVTDRAAQVAESMK